MVVGVARIVLVIHSSFSLKEKRSVLQKIKHRTINKFNLSIAEVGDNDVINRAEIGIAMVGNDRRYIQSVLDKVITFIDDLFLAEIINSEIEINNY